MLQQTGSFTHSGERVRGVSPSLGPLDSSLALRRAESLGRSAHSLWEGWSQTGGWHKNRGRGA